MVLQRQPQAAMLSGFGEPGATVEIALAGSPPVRATAGADGMWQAALAPQPASLVGTNISFVCSTGEHFQLTDILFGDTYICGVRRPQPCHLFSR